MTVGSDGAAEVLASLDAGMQAAFTSLVSGVDLSEPGLSGSIALVVPPTVGRPKRTRTTAGAASGGPVAAPLAPVQGVLQVEDGRILGWNPGEVAEDAIATLTLAAADLKAVLEGLSEPSVLFMQGVLKVDGDMRAILALLRATSTAGYRKGLVALEGATAH